MKSFFLCWSCIIAGFVFSQRDEGLPDFRHLNGVIMEVVEDMRAEQAIALPEDTLMTIRTSLIPLEDTTKQLEFQIPPGVGKHSARYIDSYLTVASVKLSSEDAKDLNKKIHQKDSYGSSQAMGPSYDLRFLKYRRGKIQWRILVSLWTNNLEATFPLRVQRQGDCMCKGSRGTCCSEGGISKSFKIYLVTLLEKYKLPVDKEEVLRIGE